jgi:hypothetical protein
VANKTTLRRNVHAPPTVANAIAYSRQLADIAAAANAELSRIAEEQVAENRR